MKSRRSIIRIAIVAITPLVCFGLLKASIVGTQTRPGARAAGGEARRTVLTTAASAKGFPRDYHAGISVSTYSLANTASGNLLTVIPITSWSGRGPAMDFNLYHNSDDGEWGTSYGAHIDIITKSEVHVFTDDGMEITFNKVLSTWVPEPGFHSTLEQVGFSGEWAWTLKDQTVYTFSDDELLIKITDTAGNVLTVNRDAGNGNRITSVVDAPGRSLNFSYDPTSGVLDYVEESFILPDADPFVARKWIFTYDGSKRLSSVTDPGSPAGVININEYDSGSRIKRIADKNGDEFTYAYDLDGFIATVTDPAPFSAQTQLFGYANPGVYRGPFLTTTYTDRRGAQWKYAYTSGTGRLVKVTDPFSKFVSLVYDSDFNVTSYTDQLSKVWTYTYDSNGNMLTATDPLTHAVTYTYDSLNNLLTVTDADNYVTELRYEAPTIDPTVPTSIILPPIEVPAEEESLRTITLDYYSAAEDSDAVGLLESVTDTNGVQTLFQYHYDGQPWQTIEGPISEVGGWWKILEQANVDAGGRLREAQRYGQLVFNGAAAGGGGGNLIPCRKRTHTAWSATNLPTSAQCTCGIGALQRRTGPNQATGGAQRPAYEANGGPPLLGSTSCQDYGSMSGSSIMDHDAMGRLLQVDSDIAHGGLGTTEESNVLVDFGYDELGRSRTSFLDTTEPTWAQTEPDVPVQRDYTYDPDWSTGEYDRTGPDGLNTHVDTDLAGRATRVERNTSSGMITADITYYDNHQVKSVTYGNGTRVKYAYFNNATLQQILHETILSDLILQLDYTYNVRDLITGISETDSVGTTTVSYTYDSRGRLLTESRAGSYPYDLSYTYDQGGNRLTKTDNSGDFRTDYHYDIDDPGTYLSKNNRLMYYEVFDISGAPVLLERVDYEYETDDAPWVGNVTKIIRDLEVDPVFYGTCLTYNDSAELWFVTEQTWEEDEIGVPFNEQTVSITEFRGGGRRRYLTRQRDPADPTQILAGTTTWYDYDGDEIYGDYEVDVVGQQVTATQIGVTEAGLAQVDYNGSGLSYFHSDHIGSTRLLTNSPSPHTIEDSYVYTAFGEKIHADGTIGTRYRYAGAFGYQNDSAFHTPDSAFVGMHVGHRYYSPSIGRFLQRDPIGISGSVNAYAYVGNNPSRWVDPTGLQTAPPNDKRIEDGYDGIGNHVPGGIVRPMPYTGGRDGMREGSIKIIGGILDGLVPVPGLDPIGRIGGIREDPGYRAGNLCASIGSGLKALWKLGKKVPGWLKSIDNALRPPNPPKYVPIEWPNM